MDAKREIYCAATRVHLIARCDELTDPIGAPADDRATELFSPDPQPDPV